jgi:hypothetical protein
MPPQDVYYVQGLQSSGHGRTPVNRRTLILGLLAVSYVNPCNAAGWTLISKEEFEQDSGAPHFRGVFGLATQPGAPVIEVAQPDEAKPIKVPVTIRLLFRPQAGAVIDLTSFRATYGWLGIDITQRIIEHAQVNASGLIANGADIPPGHHKVTLQVADNMRRVGMRTFEFTVV